MARASNVDKMTLSELLALREEIAEKIAERQIEERGNLKTRIEAMAAEAGFDVADIFGKRAGRNGAKRPSSQAAYCNPDDPSQTWSGRGRRPLWLTEKLKKRGAKLEDFTA